MDQMDLSTEDRVGLDTGADATMPAPAPGFVTTDPAFGMQIAELIMGARQADHAALDAQSNSVLQDVLGPLLGTAPTDPMLGMQTTADMGIPMEAPMADPLEAPVGEAAGAVPAIEGAGLLPPELMV